MSSMKELARLMKELEDQLVTCMRCGLCQAVCPLFAETGREADVARGKLALLSGLAQEILKNPQGVQDHLNRCLLCGSCAANCPSGVKVLDIFIKARAILAGRDFATPDDVKDLALPALRHRVAPAPESELEGTTCDQLLNAMLERVEAPRA